MEPQVDMKAIKRAAKQELGQIPGVEGFGITGHTLNIYVSSEAAQHQLPTQFKGVAVNCIVTGEINFLSEGVVAEV